MAQAYFCAPDFRFFGSFALFPKKVGHTEGTHSSDAPCSVIHMTTKSVSMLLCFACNLFHRNCYIFASTIWTNHCSTSVFCLVSFTYPCYHFIRFLQTVILHNFNDLFLSQFNERGRSVREKVTPLTKEQSSHIVTVEEKRVDMASALAESVMHLSADEQAALLRFIKGGLYGKRENV